MKVDATEKLPGEGHKRGWPPLIKMDEVTWKKIDHCSEENHEITCRAEANAKAEDGCRGEGKARKAFWFKHLNSGRFAVCRETVGLVSWQSEPCMCRMES